MVKVDATPDLVTTNQNDQIKTTEIPAINPKKYLLFSMLENSLFYKLLFSTNFITPMSLSYFPMKSNKKLLF